MSFTVNPIGSINAGEEGFYIQLDPKYKKALTGLGGFGYVQVIWWFDKCDNEKSRNKLMEEKPYKKGPDVVGTFATRSPERPNPIAVSTAYVTYLDKEEGILGLAWIDALDQTPVLDIKPYTPSADRVEHPIVPEWCSHWPKTVEQSGEFDWAAEFNF